MTQIRWSEIFSHRNILLKKNVYLLYNCSIHIGQTKRGNNAIVFSESIEIIGAVTSEDFGNTLIESVFSRKPFQVFAFWKQTTRKSFPLYEKMRVSIHNEIQIKIFHVISLQQERQYISLSYVICNIFDAGVLKKDQEEKISTTKIFPGKLSSQTCTFEKTIKPWQCAWSDKWKKEVICILFQSLIHHIITATAKLGWTSWKFCFYFLSTVHHLLLLQPPSDVFKLLETSWSVGMDASCSFSFYTLMILHIVTRICHFCKQGFLILNFWICSHPEAWRCKFPLFILYLDDPKQPPQREKMAFNPLWKRS